MLMLSSNFIAPPSSYANPNGSDIAQATKITGFCQAFDLDALDHLIVTKGSIASLASLGLFRRNQLPWSQNQNRSPTMTVSSATASILSSKYLEKCKCNHKN